MKRGYRRVQGSDIERSDPHGSGSYNNFDKDRDHYGPRRSHACRGIRVTLRESSRVTSLRYLQFFSGMKNGKRRGTQKKCSITNEWPSKQFPLDRNPCDKCAYPPPGPPLVHIFVTKFPVGLSSSYVYPLCFVIWFVGSSSGP